MPLTVSTPKTSLTGQPIVVDVDSIARLAKDIRAASPAAWKGCQKGLRAGGELIADAAARNASYSRRVPGSRKVRTTGRGNIKVSFGGDAAPNAAPIENKGRGFIRHPVYLTYDQAHSGGDKYKNRWTEKNSHPAFLAPALEETTDQVAEMALDAIESAVLESIGA